MAKAKQSGRKKRNQGKTQQMANCYPEPRETPAQLYASALTLVEQSQPREGLKQAKKLWVHVKDRSPAEMLPALDLLGEISVECGDADGARQYFEQAASLDPDGTVSEVSGLGGGGEKFLWLAQLCQEGGKTSVAWFERGAKALQAEISTMETGNVDRFDEETLTMLRIEKKRKLANALCGIVEVYMTDLSWEDDAEARCEALIAEALTIEEETSPEVLQTLASIRLSQQRKDDAQSALKRSLATWQSLEPDHPAVPDFATRISLSRLLMEAKMESEAMHVLDRLVRDDDQSVEAWYLGGWCQHLIGGRLKETKTPNGSSTVAANDMDGNSTVPTESSSATIAGAFAGSRSWLKMALKLYTQLEYEDERLYEHAKELIARLDLLLGPGIVDQEEDDEEWEDWRGISDEDGGDEVMGDV